MKHVLLAGLLVVSCSIASAQRSHGYLFIAPGGASGGGATVMTLHLGAGGDFILGKGIGIGGEIGALGPRHDYADSLFGLASVNGSYHFPASDKIDPFVTAGYSLGFRSGTENFFNFGGGLNFWFIPRLGLRLEIRDHVAREFGQSLHFWGVRFGLAF